MTHVMKKKDNFGDTIVGARVTYEIRVQVANVWYKSMRGLIQTHKTMF